MIVKIYLVTFCSNGISTNCMKPFYMSHLMKWYFMSIRFGLWYYIEFLPRSQKPRLPISHALIITICCGTVEQISVSRKRIKNFVSCLRTAGKYVFHLESGFCSDFLLFQSINKLFSNGQNIQLVILWLSLELTSAVLQKLTRISQIFCKLDLDL